MLYEVITESCGVYARHRNVNPDAVEGEEQEGPHQLLLQFWHPGQILNTTERHVLPT